ncbi:hypothetical protein [Pelagovum pacificum]|uniref:hypothetical protein n=1 Tax=Pelagovum pacificum TaxID=2588711 RepID=UPI00111E30CD|nr:hypothetical protein [Pelagovum pacificum]QQA43691.1 hypothetical protein I8N54_03690 [Pelagovum pacificum]
MAGPETAGKGNSAPIGAEDVPFISGDPRGSAGLRDVGQERPTSRAEAATATHKSIAMLAHGAKMISTEAAWQRGSES